LTVSEARGHDPRIRKEMNRARAFAARIATLAAAIALPGACAVNLQPSPKPPVQTSYTIQPNDLLLITFAGEPDYNQQARVDWRGNIDLPALATGGRAEIHAAGLTPAALAERVTEFGRANKILVAQRAQVFVSEYTGAAFVVLGQVNQPGRYTFPRGVPAQMDLAEAIGMSGGFTRLARQSLVIVKRGSKTYRVDLRRLMTAPGTERFVIVPGDVINVAERIF
jgi:protein involved in polysaccharide export with SLBB domain